MTITRPNIWFSSDIHFGHRNIIKFCDRPFDSVEAMNQAIIEDHNRVVGPDDLVFNLGDFTFGNVKEAVSYLKQMNGQFCFIRGNHDAWLDESAKNNFDPLRSIQDELLIQGSYKSKVLWVKDYYQLIQYSPIHQQKFMYSMMHYPLLTWHHSYKPTSFNLFGHTHGSINDKTQGRQMDVGIDNIYNMVGSYRPLHIEEVDGLMLAIEVDCPEMDKIRANPTSPQ